MFRTLVLSVSQSLSHQVSRRVVEATFPMPNLFMEKSH